MSACRHNHLIRALAARHCDECGAWLPMAPRLGGSWWHERGCPHTKPPPPPPDRG